MIKDKSAYCDNCIVMEFLWYNQIMKLCTCHITDKKLGHTIRTEDHVHINNFDFMILLNENLVRPDKVSLVP